MGVKFEFERRRGVDYQIYEVEDSRLCRGLLTALDWAKELKLVDRKITPSELVRNYAFLTNESETSLGLVAAAKKYQRNVISGTDYSWLALGGWHGERVYSSFVTFGKSCLTYSKQVDNKVEVRLGIYPHRVFTGRFYIYSEMVRTGVRLGVDRKGEAYVLEDNGNGEFRVLYKEGGVQAGAEERLAFWGINPRLLDKLTFDDFYKLVKCYIEEMMKKDVSYNEVLEWFRETLAAQH